MWYAVEQLVKSLIRANHGIRQPRAEPAAGSWLPAPSGAVSQTMSYGSLPRGQMSPSVQGGV